MTTIVTLVRHTDVFNPGDIMYGRLPRFGLSELGRKQAVVTAAVLAEEKMDTLYSSPQLRARHTAAIIRSAHPEVPIHISRLLAEVLTGWQGVPHAELEFIHFNFYADPKNSTDENLDALWSRIQRFVNRVRRKHSGEQTVAVTHGDICHIARAGYRGLPIDISSIRLPHPYPGKGSLTRFTFADDLRTTYPLKVEYFDPNGDNPQWSGGWAEMERV